MFIAGAYRLHHQYLNPADQCLDGQLYVGTSASEILHFVQIPPDPEDLSGRPSYILASRLPPAFHEPPTSERPGVQQILLLPKVNKACILCNWTVTFYSLPELSPVFGTTQIRPCNWIGGIDLNSDVRGVAGDDTNLSVTVLASLNKRIRVIKISEDPRALRVQVHYLSWGKSTSLIYLSQLTLQAVQFQSDVILLPALQMPDHTLSSMLIAC
jgi:hypothetical protein